MSKTRTLESTSAVLQGASLTLDRRSWTVGAIIGTTSKDFALYREWANNTNTLSIGNITDGIENIRFDSGGRVLRPNQPAFCGAQSLSVLTGNIINWNQTRLNRGGHFNAATGKFTAPVAGAYYFSASLISGSSGACTCDILVNGNVMSSGYTQYDQYNTAATTLAIELAANDWVAMKSDGTFYSGVYYGTFTGFMIG